MHVAKLRQVGGSIMLAIPPAFLEQLRLSVRASVGVVVEDGRLVIEPQVRPRYTLASLLAECDASAPPPAEDLAWTGGGAVGEELT